MRKLLIATMLSAGAFVPVAVTGPMSAHTVSAQTPSAPTFEGVTPTRILDTRSGLGAGARPVGPAETITLQVAGRAGVPADARAVVMNVTTTESSEPSFITVWPTGQERPGTSNLNTEPGQNTPNLVVARIGTGGAVELFNRGGTVHLIADVTGYSTSNDDLLATSPTRLLDTRDGTGGTLGPVGPDQTIDLRVNGSNGVPPGSKAAIVNITSTQSTQPSFVTVWPSDVARPLASTLNTEVGQNTPNLAVVDIGGGEISLYNRSGSTHLVVDLMGWLGSGSNFEVAAPTRFLDTRDGTGRNGDTQPLGASSMVNLQVAGVGGVPSNATAVVMNVTSTQSTAPSFVTVWPAGAERPTASTLNTEVGQSTPNLAIVKIGVGGSVSFFNRAGTTHLVADVAGWYVPDVDVPDVPDVDELPLTAGNGGKTRDDAFARRYSSYRWNAATGRVEAWTASGTLTFGEDFDAFARLYSTFRPSSASGTLRYDVSWDGVLSSFIGVGTSTSVELDIRVYEVSGAVIWDRSLVDEGIGADLRAVTFDRISGRERRAVEVTGMDPSKTYRVEIELRCNSRVAASAGITECDFVGDGRGATVNDWSISYPAS